MDELRVAVFRKEKNPSKKLTKRQIKKILCETVDNTFKHKDVDDDFWLVVYREDLIAPITKPPRYLALTGNGPSSKKNAYRISCLPELYTGCRDSLVFLEKLKVRNKNVKEELEKIKSKLFKIVDEYDNPKFYVMLKTK